MFESQSPRHQSMCSNCIIRKAKKCYCFNNPFVINNNPDQKTEDDLQRIKENFELRRNRVETVSGKTEKIREAKKFADFIKSQVGKNKNTGEKSCTLLR